jgi:hypothetical protein
LGENGEQDCRQDGDNRDDYEKFNEGERPRYT